MEMKLANWNIQEMTGYEPQTTFYTDFSIANHFGKEAISDTYERAFNEWKGNVVFVTELCMVLCYKTWEHYDKGNVEYTELYGELYEKLRDWCWENLKGDDLDYFFRTTD